MASIEPSYTTEGGRIAGCMAPGLEEEAGYPVWRSEETVLGLSIMDSATEQFIADVSGPTAEALRSYWRLWDWFYGQDFEDAARGLAMDRRSRDSVRYAPY